MKVLERLPSSRVAVALSVLLLVGVTQAASAAASAERVSSESYQERPALETSIFPSDKSVLDEEAIGRILNGKFVMPPTVKIALLRMKDDQDRATRFYGYGYWRSEEYLKTQASFIETLTAEMVKSRRIDEVASIPSVLTPKEPSIPLIRETAVRLQADMILVLKLTSDVYRKNRIFQSTQAKAFCTCEGFLLDVRTGIIPFSRAITKEYLATEEKPDANFDETMVRAQKEAALLSLKALGQDVAGFVDSIPTGSVSTLPGVGANDVVPSAQAYESETEPIG